MLLDSGCKIINQEIYSCKKKLFHYYNKLLYRLHFQVCSALTMRGVLIYGGSADL